MDVDLKVMPKGQTYEDRYQGYLEIFKRIAATPGRERVRVTYPPWSWVPLLAHLQCDITTPTLVFDHCGAVAAAYKARGMDRTMLEVLCSFRPETADALWKCDMQWKPKRGMRYQPSDEFIVTTNGSYHRPEVVEYMKALTQWTPTKKNVVLVPCAADKPYPAPMHQAILDMMPDHYYMMNATGVVGLVPQDLWPVMPHYDSGIPNEWRLFQVLCNYLTHFEHDRIIVYCDYYAATILAALKCIKQEDKAVFILAPKFYADYVDLQDPELLSALSRAFMTWRT